MTDDPLTECPVCGGPVRRVVGSVGIVFKGKGFYVTDHRSSNGRVQTPEKSSEKPETSSDKPEKKSNGAETSKSAAAAQSAA
jgi:hypothetical protein